ncbi:hypothetical protein FA13DRAFT_1736984 [Coprinellus micaceus]|uniref:Uncharacterized protein n=1 Tax=Coprinellus micaceus TaxID=71717 RepID=A0A4Y7SZ28_COPMI|nr:hypothetical protein FA13DRAFT_1736984 [Coprinellus micaceus]
MDATASLVFAVSWMKVHLTPPGLRRPVPRTGDGRLMRDPPGKPSAGDGHVA